MSLSPLVDTCHQALVAMASVPVLTDIELGLASANGCELYPDPLPDLFLGAPLVISGRFKGTFPAQIGIRGRLPNGNVYEAVIQGASSAYIPVSKVLPVLALACVRVHTQIRRVAMGAVDLCASATGHSHGTGVAGR